MSGKGSGRNGRKGRGNERKIRQENAGQPGQDQQRRSSFYQTHLSAVELEERGCMVGVLKVFAQRRKVGYVSIEGLKVDVLIPDEKARNRAMMGDTVALELNPQEEWVELPQGRRGGEDNSSTRTLLLDDARIRQNAATQSSLWLPRAAVIEPGRKAAPRDASSSLPLPPTPPHPIDEVSRACGKQPTGRVVAVVEASAKRKDHVGRLDPLCPVTPMSGAFPASESYVYFVPADVRYPNMIIPRLQLPDAFVANPHVGKQSIFVCDFQKEWPESSKMPLGCNVRSVGEVGNIAAETEALLTQNECNHLLFSDACMEALHDFTGTLDEGDDDIGGGQGANSNWQIPEDEIACRRDLRHERICTIDPPMAKDLDDALHIKQVPGCDDVFEVGVHIADVSYFLKEDTELDREALKRATSVYLVQKVIPMLPPVLCEQLCSLNPNVDRLAFSCIWKMNGDGTLVDEKPWFGRTVIRSCAKLDYPTAQRMVDGDIPYKADPGLDPDGFLSSLSEETWEARRRPIGQAAWALCADVRALHRCAMGRRQKRLDSGALVLHRSKLTFSRDFEGNPTGVGTYTIRESNQLVEEYMLLANYLVAQELLSVMGPSAFIRAHPPPRDDKMKELLKLAEHIGMPIDISSAAAMQESLNRISRQTDLRCLQAVSSLLMAPMNVASYSAAGNRDSIEWRHYALSIPYYTHFTSPIRRYADVMVHRLLDIAISRPDEVEAQKAEENVERLNAIAEQCNAMKENSKAAQERSDAVFFAVYIRSNPETTMATVIGIGEKSFTLLVNKYGIEARIFADEMKGVRCDFDESAHTLTLTQAHDPDARAPKFNMAKLFTAPCLTLSLMLPVEVRLIFKEEAPIDVRIMLVGPVV